MVSAAQNPDSNRPGGLFGSLKALGATLIAVALTRLELLSTEAEEEWMRIGSILKWSAVVGVCAGLGVFFIVLFIILLLWDTHRLLAVGVPAVLFILAAVVASRIVLAKIRAKPRPFSASLAELAKDRERLNSR
jgi:uncharacterized membrane protein YqjE